MGAEGVTGLLDLPMLPTATQLCRHCKALVDYSKGILLTIERYIETMELKAKKKKDVFVEAACRREEVHHRRTAQELEKQRNERERRPRRQRKHMQRRISANSGLHKL